ncbi:hypothetical protein CIRG_09250 [Coccidioides immitis RMSCC 2394]|uniref:Uncharacterized protein n=1 Tax=Coccidioides immitis RMSCC 2394 TaxID=404692 RepID=A0A0J7BI80_COCIT|nr:hypothetical protein CIRG_09250 [Coccidioides immitis RMSCC 2394]
MASCSVHHHQTGGVRLGQTGRWLRRRWLNMPQVGVFQGQDDQPASQPAMVDPNKTGFPIVGRMYGVLQREYERTSPVKSLAAASLGELQAANFSPPPPSLFMINPCQYWPCMILYLDPCEAIVISYPTGRIEPSTSFPVPPPRATHITDARGPSVA